MGGSFWGGAAVAARLRLLHVAPLTNVPALTRGNSNEMSRQEITKWRKSDGINILEDGESSGNGS